MCLAKGNTTLKQLRLDHNSIHDEGAEALAGMLNRSKLEYLSLAQNPISNEGKSGRVVLQQCPDAPSTAISKLLTVLETSTTSLRVLDLDGIALSKENRERMQRLAQQ